MNIPVLFVVLLVVAHSAECIVLAQQRRETMVSSSSSISKNESMLPFLIHFIQGKKPRNHYLYLCNGVLITPDKVLTTISCVHPFEMDPVGKELFTLAANNNNKEELVGVKRVHIIFYYKKEPYADIAVASLTAIITKPEVVFPCRVSYKLDKVNPNTRVQIAGWKFVHPSEPGSNKKKSISFVNDRQSNSMEWKQKSFQHDLFIQNSDSDRDAFEDTNGVVNLGDDGGPVILNGEVIGIASFRRNAFMKLHFYESFIEIALRLP